MENVRSIYEVTETCAELMEVNDARLEQQQLSDLTIDSDTDSVHDLKDEADREARVAALFATIGVEVEFVN